MGNKEARVTIINERYADRKLAGHKGWSNEESYRIKAATFDKIVRTYNLPKGARILEIGCGSGDTVLHMANEGFEAYGCDISRIAIKWADDKAREQNLRARFNVENVADLTSYQNDFFDMVFDGDCLWMVLGGDRQKCFAAIFRRLKPGGILYAKAHLANAGFDKRHDIASGSYFDPVQLISTTRGMPMYQYSTEAGFCTEIISAGFKILKYMRLTDISKNELPFLDCDASIEAQKPFIE